MVGLIGPANPGCSTDRPAARRPVATPPGTTPGPTDPIRGVHRAESAIAGPGEAAVIAAVIAAHNAERSRRRLGPLVPDAMLTLAAQGQADDMARRGRMSHRGSDGSSPMTRIERVGYSYRAAGENVAFGYDRVDEVMAGWMHSPGHRRNILGDYAEIGVGHVTAPGGVSSWCVTFGTPRAGESP